MWPMTSSRARIKASRQPLAEQLPGSISQASRASDEKSRGMQQAEPGAGNEAADAGELAACR